MGKGKLLSHILFIGLLLALSGSMGIGLAQGPRPAGETQSPGDVSITATVGSKFSYQGVLKENGQPASGTRDMTFRLYSDDTCTTQVGSDIVKSGVQVTDGLFSVELSVSQSYFNGQGLWLEMEVGGTKIGCQEILPVPYALGLRPGAYISGNSSGLLEPSVLSVQNGGTNSAISASSSGYALLAQSDSASAIYARTESTTDDDAAVEALATGGSGYVSGVYGASNSPNGTGVTGSATHTSGNNFGVRGLTYSSQGTGVYGWAGSNTSGTSGRPYGVYGYSNKGYGVYGVTLGDWSNVSGVYGQASMDHANGVNGVNTGGGYGVRGESNTGVGVAAKSASGNIIEAWDTDPNDRRWYVSNDGQVYADGNFHSGGADFAEMLPAVEGLEPGDVLVVGPDGRLLRSSSPYDPRVVGVYSTQPGFVGGSSDELDNAGKIPLAVVGVVPVKASAENGPIAPGDLLVASSTPGHAMKAGDNPPSGTVIGKALEGLNEGTGVIKMLVVLQ